MEEESFIGAFGDVPTDLAGDYSQLFIFRTEDFGAWYRRVRDAYNREVGSLRDETYVDTMSDADLAEHGLVRIPVDADGVPIHVGDVVTDGKYTFVVYELAVFGDGSWSIRNEDGNAWAACDVTHHHEPTVEDVLCELLNEYREGGCALEETRLSDYADKLRMVDENE